MFFAEASLSQIIGKQLLYKLKASSFIGLILMHIIVMLFSVSGSGMYSSGSSSFNVTVKYYSGDVVFFSTLVWILAISVLYTKNQYKNIDFTFVSNRISSCLSDIALLITFCVAGGITSSLSGMLLRVVFYSTTPAGHVLESTFRLPLNEILIGMAANIFYLLLVAGIGYLFGMMLEVHKAFAIIVPAFLLGLARTQDEFFLATLKFFTNESSLLFFSGKVMVTSALLFTLGILLYNRMEVRR